MSEIPIYYESRLVGRIHVRAEGPSFAYSPDWLQTKGAFPISVRMPLTHRPIDPHEFLSWAANLLPEAAHLRAVSLKLGASPEDVIGILSEIGRDTAGALSIGLPGTTSPGGWRPIPNDDDLERIIDELPNKPFLVGEDGVSMSLAGAQSKLGVAVNKRGELCIPVDGAPSTYILKPDAKDRLFGSVQNEAMCMVLARLCGLNAPQVTTGKAGSRTYFLVKRYDRIQDGERWRRLHQEDYCQALGRPPSAKYQNNQSGIPGPSLSEMFAVTRNVTQARDVMSLLDYVIFNIATCNTDAHAKNYSLMLSGRGAALAPIYDVLCADAWPNVTKNLAQRVGDKSRGAHLKKRHWERMAVECGLRPAGVVARVRDFVRQMRANLSSAAAEVSGMPAGPHVMMSAFESAIEERGKLLLLGLEEEGAVVTKPPSRKTPMAAPKKRATKKPAPQTQTAPKSPRRRR
ncbi:MAG: type II toxin-antitoxin system HipA family toxin [Hyphomonadaceae bacterium]|nr:type II toxin-antitoxin system HipA family toxin [Hyphomonadaceae bacterium]